MYRIVSSATLFLLLFCVIDFGFAADKPTVFVSIVPQKYFVDQLAMGMVNVEAMVLPGASPATYEPKSSQMKKLSTAAAYFAIGVPFEKSWLERIASVNKNMKIVHTDEGIEKRVMAGDPRHSHDHEGGADPHIWLSPALVKKQVAIISRELREILPDKVDEIEDNEKKFLRQIENLDTELRTIFQPGKGYQFLVFHPTWGYFADDYGLEQVAIEVEGKKPKPAQLKNLIIFARENGITVVFAQPQFSTKSAKLIARGIGGTVLTLDPLAENWLENMHVVADNFKEDEK